VFGLQGIRLYPLLGKKEKSFRFLPRMLVFFSIITVFTACWVKEREKIFDFYRFYRLLGKGEKKTFTMFTADVGEVFDFYCFYHLLGKGKKLSFPVFTTDVGKQK
jgi:hypothetical protein